MQIGDHPKLVLRKGRGKGKKNSVLVSESAQVEPASSSPHDFVVSSATPVEAEPDMSQDSEGDTFATCEAGASPRALTEVPVEVRPRESRLHHTII